ncbi:MAG: hypothetical protein QOH98_1092 [Methylobacteriaceae bacterium]|jgi:hypothetical protein|nr:hypothetical protein [Methylobacteriaceae bacterium]
MISRVLRAPGAVAVAGVAGLFLLIGATTHPGTARAEEGNQTLRQIFGLVTGDTGQKSTEGIDYRERPPLVLPPKMDLPPPQASAATQNPAWPNDPDVGRLKKLKAEAKAPARQVNEATANPHISQQELERGRIAASDPTSPQQNACDYSNAPECLYTPWAILKKVGSNDNAQPKDLLVPGEEPAREYLTEPPPGFRKPTQVVKATREAPKPKDDASDAGAYIRQQANHKTSVDD